MYRIEFKRKLLLFLTILVFGITNTFAHTVTVAWAFDTTGTKLRIYLEHWHSDMGSFPASATIDLTVSVSGGPPVTAFGVLPTGPINNTGIGSLPVLSGTSVNIIVTTSKSGAHNDWGYWDTPLSSLGIECDNSNPSVSLAVTVNTPGDCVFDASEFAFPQTASTTVSAPDCPLGVIAANQDDFTGSILAPGDSTGSVISNDTMNGNPVVLGNNPGELTLSAVSVPSELTLNPDGTVTVSPGAPSGTFNLTYQICENDAASTNCQIATA